MHAHVFQHVPFEGIGSIANWLNARAATVTTTRFFQQELPPVALSADLLIVMGGPMSVWDESIHPWLIEEKRAIARALERHIPVLGICLGAQLIAHVSGAKVYPNSEREIGWWPIEPVATSPGHFSFSPLTAFHWHGETFDLPIGSAHLAASVACHHQAFELPHHVIGLQFHLETTPHSARELITHARHELTEGRYVQDEATLLSAPLSQYAMMNQCMNRVLDYLVNDSPRPNSTSTFA
jgi:GMP synthase-like glutamine amidotransferase